MSYLALSVLGLCVASALGFAFWWAGKYKNLPFNESQTRFAYRVAAAALVVGLAPSVIMYFVPLPIGQWGYVAIGAVICMSAISFLIWCDGRLKALAQ